MPALGPASDQVIGGELKRLSATFWRQLDPDLKIRLRVHAHQNVILISGKHVVRMHSCTSVFIKQNACHKLEIVRGQDAFLKNEH